jgi:hypothetical protein
MSKANVLKSIEIRICSVIHNFQINTVEGMRLFLKKEICAMNGRPSPRRKNA